MKATLLILLSLILAINAHAGSATWNLNPISGDWNTAANWTPNIVPNGPSDVATFDSSAVTDVSISADTTVDSIVFAANASPFIVTANPHHILTVNGAGITSSAAEAQIFNAAVDDLGQYARIEIGGTAIVTGAVVFNDEGAIGGGPGGETRFQGFASAGNSAIVNNAQISGGGGHTFFHNYSSAANATITNLGIGYTAFNNHSSADHGTFINQGGPNTNFYQFSTAADGTFINTGGGGTQLIGRSTAASGTFINEGGTATEGRGFTIFYDDADAGNGTLIGNPGVNGGEGGLIEFRFDDNGGTSRIMIYGNAELKLTLMFDTSILTIGSLEGDGNVVLGRDTLNIGSNDLSTTFAGVIDEEVGFVNGSLGKVGNGTLTLTGASAYDGGTTVSAGILFVDNTTGSATGTGPVQVNAGTLGGSGIIAGAVTVGTNSGTGAFLAPSKGVKKPATLTIQGALTLNDDSTYIYKLKTKHAEADEVIANEVTIDSGAKFSLVTTGTSTLTIGQVFTVINNTAGSPIVGTFHNLADGAIISINGNNLQADYQGGDGNDLTLTVVP